MNLKYKTAKVISHPRAGSHYLAQLLNINFFHLPNYLPLYGGHNEGHRKYLNQPNTAVFYIYRNNKDTIKSIFKLRNRFGLVAETIEEFKENKLCDMHNVKIDSEAICNIAGKKTIVTNVDTYFRSFPGTIDTCLYSHKEYWLSITHKNFMPVNYDDLKKDFNGTMSKIAEFLSSDIIDFEQENNRIGWYDKNDTDFNNT